MRSEVEFKKEILARFEKEKATRKRRQRLMLSVVAPCIAAGLAVAVLSGYGIMGLIKSGVKGEDSVAFENAVDLGTEREDSNETADGAADAEAALTESVTDDLHKNELAGVYRVYTAPEDISAFRALIGVLSPIEYSDDNAFAATGASVVLSALGEVSEKYVITHDAVYTSDMTMQRGLSADEIAEIVRFLNENED